jgi:RNase H-fold protein (predicted Holliday junction resolvase)
MGMSVSLKKATNKTNIKHNNRDLSDKEKERNSHIDDSRSDENKYLVQENLRELYKHEFGDSLENYNAKQKRNDRKIDDYYKHIEKSKKTSLQQEMIIQVGDKDDFSSSKDFASANEILEEWFNEFQERNPNLKVYNAVIHNDEASPHMHLNFVPVASDYKRGLEKQVSFDRAIKQQDATLDKTRPFDDWREKEVQVLEKMLKERGIERKLVGTNEYKDVNDYKDKKDLEKEIQRLEKNLSEKKNELLAYSEQVPNEIKVPAKRQMKNVEVPTGEKTLFGKEKTRTEKKPTKNVIISENDYKKLVLAAKDNERLKGTIDSVLKTDIAQVNMGLGKENKALSRDLKMQTKENKELRLENMELKRQNSKLNTQISDLKHDVRLIYESTKEFLKEHTNGLKAFKNVFKGFVDKVRNKTMDFQDKRNMPLERNEFEKVHAKELRKEKDRGMEL